MDGVAAGEAQRDFLEQSAALGLRVANRRRSMSKPTSTGFVLRARRAAERPSCTTSPRAPDIAAGVA